ncbi:4077_t:CDS:2, partial [Racocetra persica]
NNTKGSQQTITTMLQCVVLHKGTKKLNICRAVAEWLVIDNQPFEVISGEGFRRFMLQIDPAFRWPSYKTLKKEISIANTTAKSQINNLLARSKRLPCTAYTLQLSINHAFKAKRRQIIHIQNLVKFFDSPKQSQRLDTVQLEMHKNKQKEISYNNPISSDESENN